MTPVVLTDNYVLSLINRKDVQATFPEFAAYAQQTKSNRGCSSCSGRQPIMDTAIENARQFILSMPDAQRKRLKNLLGVGDRTFLVYRRKKGGPFERIEV